MSSTSPHPCKELKYAADYDPTGWHVIYACQDSTPDTSWGFFYKQWWGLTSTGAEELKQTCHLEKLAIQVGSNDNIIFGLLQESKGWMIMRQEYHNIYDRLSHVFERRGSGIILTGQPGIGKSYFAIYALLRCMMEGRMTLFTTSDGLCYLFDETGIRVKKEAQFNFTDLPESNYLVPTSRTWSIFDTPKHPDESLLAHGKLFVLVTCPPKRAMYKEWMKQARAVQWVMNPWSEEELCLLISNPNYTNLSENERNQHGSPDGIQKLLYDVGPCPRDILDSIQTPIKFNEEIKSALMELHDVDMLITLFTSADNQPNSISHKVTLITRCEPRVQDSDSGLLVYDSDICRVDFKSQKIRKSAMKHFEFLTLTERKYFIQFTKSCPAGSQLASWVFEGFAHASIETRPSELLEECDSQCPGCEVELGRRVEGIE
ncbi:hypothetical protein APHAL10511_003412 [Amanita phalloides]|nr:hypothetical protein APHAL10511_003412 [Amanita phalloides]